ncbi:MULTISPECIES: HAD family hydrolase [Bacillus]|uniref:HAD family hydrolase n=1 Tax=Bacillus TaxID=1386 RepID=UPI0002DE45B1|nr:MULTISPECIES: HAD hydrolase family protein [Bacillus]
MQYKMIFFDIDEILSHYEKGSIPSKTKEVINDLQSKGYQVVAAIGRPLSMCKDIEK